MATPEIITPPSYAQAERKKTTSENFSRYLEAQLGLTKNTVLGYSSALADLWPFVPLARGQHHHAGRSCLQLLQASCQSRVLLHQRSL